MKMVRSSWNLNCLIFIVFLGPDSNDHLQYAVLPLTTNEECQKIYSEVKPGMAFDSVICTKVAGGKDTCHGDSGGPLVVPDESNRAVITGITSWGHSCGKYPGVYTRVTSYLDWINSVMSQ